MWELCDLAEVELRRRKEADDMLNLLAGLAGAKPADYQTPSEELHEQLWEQHADVPLTARERDPDLRRAQIVALALAAGGDFG